VTPAQWLETCQWHGRIATVDRSPIRRASCLIAFTHWTDCLLELHALTRDETTEEAS
jgi:hypothetical protein